MNVSLKEKILTLDGDQVEDEKGKKQTLGMIVRSALCINDPEDSAMDKQEKFKLAVACSADEVELSAEDVSLIKKTVGKYYSPLILGRVIELIDP